MAGEKGGSLFGHDLACDKEVWNSEAYVRFGGNVGRVPYRRSCDHARIDPLRGGINWADYRPRARGSG
jgi:hypothetical protein